MEEISILEWGKNLYKHLWKARMPDKIKTTTTNITM